MAKTIEYIIRTKDENGNVINETKYSQECDFPTADEINTDSIEGFLNDFDKIEKAVISSRKNAEKKFVETIIASEDKKNEKIRLLKIDAEIGSLNVLLSYDSAKHTPPKKRLLSLWIQAKLLLCIKRNSFRDAEEFMNEFLNREEGELFHHRTLADYIHAEGEKATALVMEKARATLEMNDFDPESALPLNPEALSSSVVSPNLLPDEEMIKRIDKAEAEYNAKHDEFPIGEVPTAFIPEKSPDDAVYISVDDVLVKHQKDERNNPEYVKDKKNVANTVIHVQANGRAYVISAIGMANAFIILMAVFVNNKMEKIIYGNSRV